MTYTSNAVKAAEAAAKAWSKAAFAMANAREASDPDNYFALGTVVSAVARARQAAIDCNEACEAASDYANNTFKDDDYDVAECAANAACAADEIAQDAANDAATSDNLPGVKP